MLFIDAINLIRHKCEIKSIAVLAPLQRHGIGTKLAHAAVEHARSHGCIELIVGTATADIDNLAFYQRLGFRIDRIERDTFIADRGYFALESNGIQARDRLWLSMDLHQLSSSAASSS